MNIYADIIHQPRPESSHPRMRREERAKLFAPFAASAATIRRSTTGKRSWCPGC